MPLMAEARFFATILAASACALLVVPALIPPGSRTIAARAHGLASTDPALPGPYAVGVIRRSFTRPSSTTGEPRVLYTVIWYPAIPRAEPDAEGLPPRVTPLGIVNADPDRTNAPYPVLVFSHGFRGTAYDSSYLHAHLASHGFVVVAPFHPGPEVPPDCPAWPEPPTSTSACTDRGGVDPDSLTNRPADLAFALDSARHQNAVDDPLLAGLVDDARAGLAGFSFGGWTALRELADEPRFRAAVAMAPGNPGLELRQSISGTRSPIMLIAGRMDAVVPFSPADTRVVPPGTNTLPVAPLEDVFPDLLAAPDRWLVVLPHGGHFSFTAICPPGERNMGRCPETLSQEEAHTRIRRWATAFLLHYVAADERYAALLDPELAVGDPEIEIRLGQAR